MATKFEPALTLLLHLSRMRGADRKAASVQAAHVLQRAQEDTGLSPTFLERMSRFELCQGDAERNAATALRDVGLFGGAVRELPVKTQRALRGLVVIAETMHPHKTRALLRG
jgi:hypothetical protein